MLRILLSLFLISFSYHISLASDAHKITILDGGMGSEIKRRGLPFNETDWSAKILMSDEKKDFNSLIDIHLDYINSGADVITTNSYGVCLIIGRDKYIKNGTKYIKKSILAATEAKKRSKNNKILIAGSISPVFGSYQPSLFNKKEAKFLYQKTIPVMIASKDVDILLAETLSSIEEALFLTQYINNNDKKFQKPYWLSFTLYDTLVNNEAILRSKEKIDDIIKILDFIENSNYRYPEAILFNCSQPEIITIAINKLSKILEEKNLNVKIGGYANRFVKEENIKADVANELRKDLSENNYLEFTKKWTDSGATIIGGCCGIGPSYIKKISKYYKL